MNRGYWIGLIGHWQGWTGLSLVSCQENKQGDFWKSHVISKLATTLDANILWLLLIIQ